jgi:hypothetical protein
MCLALNFLPSKQHTQNFLGCQLFAKKLQVNCSAQLFGFAQKILGTKHAPSEQRMQSPTDSERHFPRETYLCWQPAGVPFGTPYLLPSPDSKSSLYLNNKI